MKQSIEMRSLNRQRPGAPGQRTGERPFRCTRIAILGAILCVSISGCASAPAGSTRSWLDEQTAVTVTVQKPTAVFSHEDQTRSLNLRDYAEVGALEVNVTGTRHYYLVIMSWSTIDRDAAEMNRIDDAFSKITLWCDARPIELTRTATDRSAIQVGQPVYPAPTTGAREAFYEIRREQLAALPAARSLKLTAHGVEGQELVYEEWQDGRAGFAAFLASTASGTAGP